MNRLNICSFVRSTLFLLTLVASQSQATVIVNGQVDWQLSGGVTPQFDMPTTQYGWLSDASTNNAAYHTQGQGFDQLQGGALWLDHDTQTGQTVGFASSVSQAEGQSGTFAVFNMPTIFYVTTDILSFDLLFEFSGSRDLKEDIMFANIQLLVEAQGEIFYSDYHPNHATYWTKHVESSNSEFELLGSGSVNHTFGEQGVLRDWAVSADIWMGARDSVGQMRQIPTPGSIFICMLGLILLLVQSKRATRPV